MPSKPCTKCGRTLPLGEFYRHRRAKDGRQGECKDCRRRYAGDRERNSALALRWHHDHREQALARQRRWRTENVEREAARQRRWRTENAERASALARMYEARKRAAVPPDEDEDTLMWVDQHLRSRGLPCPCCAEPAATVDHAHPVSRGGAHAVWNLLPACGRCNSRKFVTPYSEYVNRIGGVRNPLAFSRAIEYPASRESGRDRDAGIVSCSALLGAAGRGASARIYRHDQADHDDQNRPEHDQVDRRRLLAKDDVERDAE